MGRPTISDSLENGTVWRAKEPDASYCKMLDFHNPSIITMGKLNHYQNIDFNLLPQHYLKFYGFKLFNFNDYINMCKNTLLSTFIYRVLLKSKRSLCVHLAYHAQVWIGGHGPTTGNISLLN